MAYQNTGDAPSASVSARGVWHRPNVTNEETTLEGICSVLDQFQHAGINLIFLETFYHGMTVFKTPTVEYYTGFENYDYGEYPDYLSAFVAEAKKRNIEVHAWVEDFYIGVNSSRFVKNCPQWLLLNAAGSYRQSEGKDYGGYIFLDPANPEVRKYLVDFYRELLTKFPDIKGLNLDYIRYPVSSRTDDAGFSQIAMAEFADIKGWQLSDNEISTFINKLNSTNSHDEFTSYRADNVTGFVGEVYEMIKTSRPEVVLSTAIFPDAAQTYNAKKQDFRTWLDRGYIDIVTPMAYYDDDGTLRNALQSMMKDCKDVYCYAGLSSTYHSLSENRVLSQLEVCEEVGADGFIFFGSQSILNKQNYIELLHGEFGSVGEYDITPHGDAGALCRAITDPLFDELFASGAENPKKINELKLTVQGIWESKSLSELDEAVKNLELLVKYNLQAYVSSENLSAASERFELLYRYAYIYASRARVKALMPQAPPETDTSDTADETTEPDEPSDLQTTNDTRAPEVPIGTTTEEHEKNGKNSNGKLAILAAAAAAAAVLVTVAVIIIKKKR